ncbi:MAG: hypothetical protein HYV63_14680 [Candidatus Schekmanbacteria bacterium]|nr:hypothetical protein [Candidatus Schekmanbacteria bacterium]
MNDALQSAAGLVRQLLAFRRRRPEEPKVIPVDPLLQDTSRLLERLLGERITVRSILESAGASVEVDPTQLQQVLMNPAINAANAMPNGGAVTIAARRKNVDKRVGTALPPGAYVVLEITDTGVGMDEATQEIIFEPFFTTKEEGKGTGLELSIVLGIARQYGAAIPVDSVPGCGTTFEVLFPLAEQRDEVPARTRPLEVSGSRPRILLVDHQLDTHVSLAQLLRRRGFDVAEVAEGASALAHATSLSTPVDLMIAAPVLPDVDGPELVRRLFAERPQVLSWLMRGMWLAKPQAWLTVPVTATKEKSTNRSFMNPASPRRMKRVAPPRAERPYGRMWSVEARGRRDEDVHHRAFEPVNKSLSQ